MTVLDRRLRFLESFDVLPEDLTKRSVFLAISALMGGRLPFLLGVGSD